MSKTWEDIISNADMDVFAKLQALADDAIESAKKPSDVVNRVPALLRAIILFDFSLGMLSISYQNFTQDMVDKVREIFKKEAMRRL